MRRVSGQNRTGPLHRADFHSVFIWQTGWFSARLQVILCKIIRKSENQPGLARAEEFYKYEKFQPI